MKNLYTLLIISIVLLLSIKVTHSQNLEIFGFFQPTALHGSEEMLITAPAVLGQQVVSSKTSIPKDHNSFTIQQTNIMARNNFGKGFSGFLNLEITNSFANGDGWGDLSLQEAFVRYEYNNLLNVKIGQFLPTFNNMYEIYNRTPLLPFMMRPIIYEPFFTKTILNASLFLPQKAFMQIDGNLPVGQANLDYAAYIANLDPSFSQSSNDWKEINYYTEVSGNKLPPSKGEDFTNVSGQQLTENIAFGGRLGIRYNSIKAGFSYVQDRYNLTEMNISPIVGKPNNKDFGTPVRNKLGGDLSLSFFGFTLMGEAIYAKTNLSDAQKDSLWLWSNITPTFTSGGHYKAKSKEDMNVDALFYFVVLQFDITEKIFVYSTYSSWYNNENEYTSQEKPLTTYGGGIGFRASDNVVFKVQYFGANIPAKEIEVQGLPVPFDLEFNGNYFTFGVSVAL
jgi:hypothetical protein